MHLRRVSQIFCSTTYLHNPTSLGSNLVGFHKVSYVSGIVPSSIFLAHSLQIYCSEGTSCSLPVLKNNLPQQSTANSY